MASSIKKKDIKELREARYLAKEVARRLPAKGQIVPTPEPNESVIFISHFLRGLGFSIDPFIRGLMFYYGLDFHDLAPDSILHISSFIVVCEAFLSITPHFGLWLKTFNVARWQEIHGQKVPFQRCPNYGNGSGFTSRLPEVPSGRLPPLSAQAPHHN